MLMKLEVLLHNDALLRDKNGLGRKNCKAKFYGAEVTGALERTRTRAHTVESERL